MYAVSIYYSIQIAAKLSFSSFVCFKQTFMDGRSTWNIERRVFAALVGKRWKKCSKSMRTLCVIIF